MKKVFGVGTNDVPYFTQKFEYSKVDGKRKNKLVWICPYYRKWKDMLKRCYYQTDFHTYKECRVESSWLSLSCFTDWCKEQERVYGFSIKDMHLDKDILFIGNKVYCSEFCVFVDGKVNTFVLDSKAIRGDYKIGVSLNKTGKKYEAWCRHFSSRSQKYIGVFNTEDEAHEAWRKTKHKYACELADSNLVVDDRVSDALRTRYLKDIM